MSSLAPGATEPGPHGPRPTWRVIAALVLFPLLVTATLVWLADARTQALGEIPAAIVNNDKIITGDNPMAAGRAVASQLTHPPKGQQNLSWTVTDAKDAREGLASGRYYSVLTIPEDYSKNVLSTGTDHPAQATMSIQSNDASSSTVGIVSQAVATAAGTALGQQVTQGYLTNVYAGFSSLHDSLSKADSSSHQLADGAAQLASGASSSAQGAATLATSVAQIAQGARQVDTASGQLASGAATLATGAAQAAAGATSLATAARTLSAGSTRLAGSASTLASRADTLKGAAGKVSTGTSAWASGQTLLASALGRLATDCHGAGASDAYCDRVAVEAKAAHALAAAGTTVKAGASGVATGAKALAAGTRKLSAGQAAQATGAGHLASASKTLASGTEGVASGAATLSTGAASLDTATASLASGAGQAASGAASLASGSATLATSASQLSSGAASLASGLDQAVQQTPTYSDDESKALSSVVSQPVALTSSTLHSGHRLGWPVSVIAALVLWAGALVGLWVGRGIPLRGLFAPVSSRQIVRSVTRSAVVLGVTQALCILLVVFVVRVNLASAVGFSLFVVVGGVAFWVLATGARAAFGRVGIGVLVVFLALQVASLGYVVPIQTAPQGIQSLAGLLPLNAFVDGATRLATGGVVGSILGAVVVLALWMGLGLLLIAWGIRRRRIVSAGRFMASTTAPPLAVLS